MPFVSRLLPSARAAGAVSCALVALCGAAAAPAGAAQFRGAADFPANGALPGGQDLVHAEASYDDAGGALRLVARFREAPAQGDVLAGAFGVRGGDGQCGFPAVVFAGVTGAAADPLWRRYDGGGANVASGTGARQQEGATVTYTFTDPSFAAQGYDCVSSLRITDHGADAVVKSVDGFPLAPLLEPPATPPPTTTTTPQPPAPAPDRSVAARPVARLAAGVVGAPTRTVAKGRWTTLKLRLLNSGTAAARRTTVTVSGSRGVSVRVVGAARRRPGTRALKTLRAGRASTVAVRVRAARAGLVRFRVTAAGGLSASGRVALRLKRRTTAPRPNGRRAPRPALRGPLADRYFWGTTVDPMYAWRNHAIWFVDDRWAYYGFPPAGRPRCGAPTTVTDEKGNPTDDGCRPYTYDPRTGALTVGALHGSFSGGGVRLGELEFGAELSIPRAGARLDVDLGHSGFSGMCGLITGCTTWHYLLVLRVDGRFMRSNSATSTMGDGTSTPFVWGSNMPPDKTGTYEILAGGAIRFRYLDGRVEAETIGIERTRGRDDPSGKGLLLGDTNYYPDDDD